MIVDLIQVPEESRKEIIDILSNEHPHDLNLWMLKKYKAREIPPQSYRTFTRFFVFDDVDKYMEFCLRWL